MDNLFNTAELSPSEKAKASRKRTAALTQAAIKYLNDTGYFVCHRSNNQPSTRLGTETIEIDTFDCNGHPIKMPVEIPKVFHKKNNVQVTILDISGFTLPHEDFVMSGKKGGGVHVELEVKTGTDTLKPDQKQRIQDIQKAGGISFMFSSMEMLKVLIEPYLPKYDDF